MKAVNEKLLNQHELLEKRINELTEERKKKIREIDRRIRNARPLDQRLLSIDRQNIFTLYAKKEDALRASFRNGTLV